MSKWKDHRHNVNQEIMSEGKEWSLNEQQRRINQDIKELKKNASFEIYVCRKVSFSEWELQVDTLEVYLEDGGGFVTFTKSGERDMYLPYIVYQDKKYGWKRNKQEAIDEALAKMKMDFINYDKNETHRIKQHQVRLQKERETFQETKEIWGVSTKGD